MSQRLYRFYLFLSKLKKRVASRVSPGGRLFVFFTFLALLFGMDTRSTMIYQLAALMVVVVFFSFLCSFFFPPEIRVRRKLPETCTAGDELSYVLELTNPGKKPSVGLLFQEQSAEEYPSAEEFASSKEAGEMERNYVDRKFGYYRWQWLLNFRAGARFESFSLPEVGSAATVHTRVVLTPMRRGYIRIGGYTVHRLDVFGIFKNEVFVKAPDKLLVLPKLYPVEQGELAGARKYHQGGFTSAASTGETGEFVSLRDYRAGDPVKNIDWKVTARVGSAVVRQYQDEYFSRNGLLLDTFAEYENQVFEDAVSVAASIVARQDSAKSLIDLLFACDSSISSVSMGPGQSDKQHILEILACIAPCRDHSFSLLSNLVISHSGVLSGLILVFVTMDEERKKLLDNLVSMKIPHKVILVTADREASEILLQRFPAENIALFDVRDEMKLVRLG